MQIIRNSEIREKTNSVKKEFEVVLKDILSQKEKTIFKQLEASYL